MVARVKVELSSRARIPTEEGEFELRLYLNDYDKEEHLALVHGEVEGKDNVLVRVHSECFTGEVLGSKRCDCGEQFFRARQMIARNGSGVIVYMRQEGRGIGLNDKLRAYNLQDEGYDTVDANLILGHQVDERDYTVAAAILKDLGVKTVLLVTNNPQKIIELKKMGIVVKGRVPLAITVTPENERYLRTKKMKMNHILNIPEDSQDPKNGRIS
jgi:3,4-dihydroxy 2-butanone 4-phosphate synthase/GTP cyclohydrolase II